MADHHHHHHRPQRLSLPPRATVPAAAAATPRPYPFYPYPPSTPTPTPSKHRLSSLSVLHKPPPKRTSVSSLFLLLLSLRSLYSLLPFLRSSPSSFSLFPFSFLVSLLSFLLTLSFSLFTPFFSSRHPFRQNQHQPPIFSLTLITQSQHRLLVLKSIFLAIVFLLRFQALRYCGTAGMILAELTGNVAARFFSEGRNRRHPSGSSKVRGLFALFLGLFLLSISWDRIECFPVSAVNVAKFGFPVVPSQNCVRVWPMLLPFLSGFLGCYERVCMNWVSIRELGRKRIRLISLFFTTVVLFIPAVISMFVFEADGDSISIGSLGWPLANTVVFGVLLSENYTDDKLVTSKDFFQREFLVTFGGTLLLELLYFPELSLWGFLICGFLLGIAVRYLDPVYSNYLEVGLEPSESFTNLIVKPTRHILSERKSRKIALFLLINMGYMVVEFVVGFMSNSLGLISDACHMLFDCAALAIGLYASYISRLPANGQFNYGRGRFEVLSGYVNAVFLVLVGALIVLESLERILDPQEISTNSLLTVSIGGLVVNVVGLIFFHEEHHHAHGGTGSCSHSHSHLHSHAHVHQQHHSDDHSGHDHKAHGIHHECKAISHDCHKKSCSVQGDLCSDSHDHHDHVHNHDDSHQHGHDHHDHVHVHNHDDSHQHGHDHQDHVHNHDHHENHHHRHHLHVHADHPADDHSGGDSHLQGSLHIHVCSSAFEARSCAGSIDSQPRELPSHREEMQKQHRHVDHNMEGIFLHVLADTMGSVGVVISTLLIKYKGWLVADPVCSIFISFLIVSSVVSLLRNSAEVLLQRVPRAHEQDLKEALNGIVKIKGVRGIQNLHVWSFTNTEVVGTLHLHVSAGEDEASAKARVLHILHDAGIKDLTVQVERVKNT